MMPLTFVGHSSYAVFPPIPPLDIDNMPVAEFAYGMRKLRAAYAGSCLRIRRSSDNAEQDFGFDGEGDLDTAAIATFIGAGSGFVKTWYDQSGNGRDVTQATTANQPLYVASGQNGKPTIRWDDTNDMLTVADGFSSTNVCFAMAYTPPATGTNKYAFLILGTTYSALLAYFNGDPQFLLPEGSVATYNGNHNSAKIIVCDGIEGVGNDVRMYVDGSLADTGASQAWTDSGSNAIYVGSSNVSQPLNGDIYEFFGWSVLLITAIRGTLESNINAYWSIY